MTTDSQPPRRVWGMGPIADFIDRHGLRARFDALGPDKVADVPYGGRVLRFHIPDAMTDKMQIPALMGRLHEAPLLERFAGLAAPGGVVLDLGANHGSHTVFFAAIMGARRVHAFEPQPRMAVILRKTVALNGLSNVVVHQAAVGARAGHVRLAQSNAENTGMASFRPDPGGDVAMVAIDQVVTDAPVTAIKIDIEGMQMPALRGMVRTLRRDRPVLWLELRPAKGEVEAPTAWLARLGYQPIQVGFRDFFFLPTGVSGGPEPGA
ncbi:FkbM family methyltransferase [Paracoccus sp. p4-l81]|uniref:FkbM family methyltransferase n=1 Tax=unclassified Paracoccus (in: a-proteobacteria) TaxID=2688777 RepID=UPI0035B81860